MATGSYEEQEKDRAIHIAKMVGFGVMALIVLMLAMC